MKFFKEHRPFKCFVEKFNLFTGIDDCRVNLIVSTIIKLNFRLSYNRYYNVGNNLKLRLYHPSNNLNSLPV